jgi:hypothetical protein
VPVGASSPYQVLQSKPGNVSAIGGKSGATFEVFCVATAIGLTRPALIIGETCGSPEKSSCTRPAARSITAGPPPL